MEFKDILYGKADGVAVITLNRPDVMNALVGVMLEEVMEALRAARDDDEVRVVVITGNGRAFCSGAAPGDLAKGRHLGPPTLAERHFAMLQNIGERPKFLASLDKPYIAAINGAAVGGGLDLALEADIRIASGRAKFGAGYVRMGVVSPQGGAWRLPRAVGVAAACELMWSGRIIDAQEALRIGLVSRVVAPGEVMPATLELAQQIARGPAVAVQLAKRLICRSQEVDLDHALELAERATLIAQSTEDAKEGPRAFMEKREPVFRGR
jgi:enoyl-CoA hydratase/carnithine racemase